MEVLPDGPSDARCAAAASRPVSHDGIGRHARTTASPLPHGLVDPRLLAPLIVRQVRAGRGSAAASGPHHRAIAIRSGRAPRATPSRPVGPAVQPCVTTGRWSDAVPTLFAELACRHAHALTPEESRYECHDHSTDALRSARVCLRAAIDAGASAGESREHGTAISSAGARARPGLVTEPRGNYRRGSGPDGEYGRPPHWLSTLGVRGGPGPRGDRVDARGLAPRPQQQRLVPPHRDLRIECDADCGRGGRLQSARSQRSVVVRGEGDDLGSRAFYAADPPL